MSYGDKIGINDAQVGVAASRENHVAHFNGPEEEALMRLIWRAERSYNG